MTTFTLPSDSNQSIAAFTGLDTASREDAFIPSASIDETVSDLLLPQLAMRIEVEGHVSKSMSLSLDRLNEILALPHNWDSYGGSRISMVAAMATVEWLSRILIADVPAPSVVPGSDGSIQLEWHTGGIDLEVWFPSSGHPEFSFEDQNTGDEDDGHLPSTIGLSWAHVLQLAGGEVVSE